MKPIEQAIYDDIINEIFVIFWLQSYITIYNPNWAYWTCGIHQKLQFAINQSFDRESIGF